MFMNDYLQFIISQNIYKLSVKLNIVKIEHLNKTLLT